MKEAAKNLYSTLRKIKKDNYKSIAVEKIPNKGLGKTINDRLMKASKILMQTPLKVVELSKDYNDKNAVKNISFEVKENEIIGILGPNGCGKTTTIGMILGLLKPTNGKGFN